MTSSYLSNILANSAQNLTSLIVWSAPYFVDRSRSMSDIWRPVYCKIVWVQKVKVRSQIPFWLACIFGAVSGLSTFATSRNFSDIPKLHLWFWRCAEDVCLSDVCWHTPDHVVGKPWWHRSRLTRVCDDVSKFQESLQKFSSNQLGNESVPSLFFSRRFLLVCGNALRSM